MKSNRTQRKTAQTINHQPSALNPPARLPFLRTFEDAAALCEREGDQFYLAAFLFQLWLSGLPLRAAAEYAEKKNPKDRSLQNGYAWISFLERFTPTTPGMFRYLLSFMFRFAASDDSPGNTLRRALVPLSVEHHATGQFFGPKTIQAFRSESRNSLPRQSEATAGQPLALNDLARDTIQRWCDWLDSAVHLQTHRRWHTSPVCFDPDPEKRELATLGNAQRQLAWLSPRAKACWLEDFAAATVRYKNSPKWAIMGKAMGEDPGRPWPYADIDTLVISLWPLVTRYNWTYRDLRNVVREAIAGSRHAAKREVASGKGLGGLTDVDRYPLESEQEFATYCTNVLGLRKTGRGASAMNGRPRGYEIAQQLCPGLSPGGPSSTRP